MSQLTEYAKTRISKHFRDSGKIIGTAVDATCGNGNDTLFLAAIAEHVYGFDIQDLALKKTNERLTLESLNNKVTLVLNGHEKILEYVNAPADIIMFNLGYLPQADKTITTLSATTLIALNASLKILSKNGILSLLCYPGHHTGKIETAAVLTWAKQLSTAFRCEKILSHHHHAHSPILLLITYE